MGFWTVIPSDVHNRYANSLKESYHSEPHISINYYLIEFQWHVSKIRRFQIILLEPVLAYHPLKSSNLSPDNERLIRATITNFTLLDMTQQFFKKSMEIQPWSTFHSDPFL